MITLKVTIDDQTCEVPVGMSVAAALTLVGNGTTRRSASGQLRAPLCGMGVCQECHVMVNGHRVLAYQTECQPEVVVERSHRAKRRL